MWRNSLYLRVHLSSHTISYSSDKRQFTVKISSIIVGNDCETLRSCYREIALTSAFIIPRLPFRLELLYVAVALLQASSNSMLRIAFTSKGKCKCNVKRLFTAPFMSEPITRRSGVVRA